MPVFSVLEFVGLSYSVLFQILPFSVLGCLFIFVCTVGATVQGHWHVDNTLHSGYSLCV